MILINIILCFVVGFLLVNLFGQYKHINIFEQLCLGFVSALSIFVFILFMEGILINSLSPLGIWIISILIIGFFVYRLVKNKTLGNEMLNYRKKDIVNIKAQCHNLHKWQKLVAVGIVIYALVKLFMVFQVNISMPTFDEDAVASWDMKAKIFAENKSLVLDDKDPEFLGTSLHRIIYAPITDYYFLEGSSDFDGFSNIISFLVYLNIVLLLFGILLRYTNLFGGLLGVYIFTSLPFLRIQGVGSYWNLPFAYFIFVFGFYLAELSTKDHKPIDWGMIILLGIVSFIVTGVRNEGFILVFLVWLVSLVYHYIKNKSFFMKKNNMIGYGVVIIGLVLSFGLNNYLKIITPVGVDTESHLNMIAGGNIISKLSGNLAQDGVFIEPFKQMFLHPDYNLIFILLTMVILYAFISKRINSIIVQFIGLFGALLFLLWVNLDFGLMSHIGFIRYGVLICVYLIFIIISVFYDFYKNSKLFEE